jgi:peroxiredoxin
MKPGDVVPDLTFARPDGSRVNLHSCLHREFLLLIFLRHLA